MTFSESLGQVPPSPDFEAERPETFEDWPYVVEACGEMALGHEREAPADGLLWLLDAMRRSIVAPEKLRGRLEQVVAWWAAVDFGMMAGYVLERFRLETGLDVARNAGRLMAARQALRVTVRPPPPVQRPDYPIGAVSLTGAWSQVVESVRDWAGD